MRSAAAFARKPVAPQQQYITYDKMLPSPLAGWVSATNLAEPVKRSAMLLENWFATRRTVRMRGGSFRHATVGAPAQCQSLFVYKFGTLEKLFGTTSGAIYNISSPADPDVAPAADITGQTSGYYSTAHSANASGTVFMTVVNGTDTRQLYDGTTWATTPAITGVTSANLSHVWVFANRLFFVEKNTLNAWYLDVDAVGGAATKFSLAGIFQNGGNLLTGGTWSVDAGDGMHDQCVFISDNGEVVVYQGTDPDTAATWVKVGRYETGLMLGKNAMLKVAGDLILMTVDGFVPMSMVKALDRAALGLNAISRNIEPDWKAEAHARPTNWTVVKWPEKEMTLIGLPYGANLENICFAVNSETGAWAKFTGWDTNCVALFNNNVYFGNNSGRVLIAESGGYDDGAVYTARYVGQHENLGHEGATKIAQLMRSTFVVSTPFTPKITVSTNFNGVLPSPPSAATVPVGDTWDVGLFDVAVWDNSLTQTVTTRWRSVAGQGFVLAPVVQVTSGATTAPGVEMVMNHVKFGLGGYVV